MSIRNSTEWKRRVTDWSISTMAGLFSYAWYSWLYDSGALQSVSRVTLIAYGLPPVIVAISLSIFKLRGRFAPVGATVIGMVMALQYTIYAHQPDLAFYAGKTLWAAKGDYTVDPAMGMSTAYPWCFFVIWGWIARLSGSHPLELLRWASVWNLVALWGVLWWCCRKWWSPVTGTAIWVASLALFAKEIAGYLFASPACFSMPLALAGWMIWAKSSHRVEVVIGALSLALAILIWPAHLFGALGVGLVMGLRRLRSPIAWVYAFAILGSGGIALAMRLAVPGGESLSILRAVPSAVWPFIVSRLGALLTIGTDAHGPVVTGAGVATLGSYIALAVLGSRSTSGRSSDRSQWALFAGLSLGALLASWFMVQAAYGVRMLFVALITLSPLAAAGFEHMTHSNRIRLLTNRRLLIAGLAALWLVPFLTGISISAAWHHRWHARSRQASEWLAIHAHSADRVWASPDTFCNVVLGKMPVFGFLAHRWPLYFGAPQSVADSVAALSDRLSRLGMVDDWQQALSQEGVDWVVIDRSRDAAYPLATALAAGQVPHYLDSAYSIYAIPTRR